MEKGKLIFKTEKQAGKVCTLLNKIKDAEQDGRCYHFHRSGKTLSYSINTREEQDKVDKMVKKLKKTKVRKRGNITK